jgi:putative protein kinase ArgK-like GTPase of G3E family
MANNNIAGLELNIDHDFISDVVRQVALASIAEAMDKDNHIVEAIVRQVLRQTVNEDGKVPSYGSGKYTLLEYYVRKMLTDEVRKQVLAIVDEKRPEIAELIGAELRKEATAQRFTNAFIGSIAEALDNRWSPQFEVTFKKDEDEF